MRALDIIKAMPLDEGLKTQIVSRYDDLKPAQKLAIDYMAWTTFYDLYEETLEDNLGIQYANVKKNEDHFSKDFYNRAQDKTDQQMMNELEESLSKADLSIARQAMEKIMQEIQASKHKGNHKSQ